MLYIKFSQWISTLFSSFSLITWFSWEKTDFANTFCIFYFGGHLLFSLFELFNRIVFLPTDWDGCHGKVSNHFDSESLLMKLNLNADSSDYPFVLWRHQLRVFVDGNRNFSMRKLAVYWLINSQLPDAEYEVWWLSDINQLFK